VSTTERTSSESAGSEGHRRRLVRWLVPRPLPQPINPALLKESEERAQDLQNRLADKITAFAGSMTFVYIHAGSDCGSDADLSRQLLALTKKLNERLAPEEPPEAGGAHATGQA
jgi:hypothetical protein